MERKRVAVLGATGMVGQIYLQRLADHPWFEVSSVTGKNNVGKKLIEAYRGRGWVPKGLADMEVLPTDPSKVDADVVFSSLPTQAAREVEPRFAEAGFIVVSDASAFRMQHDVPLMVPEINPNHLELLDLQRRNRGWDGAIITTPNCTTVGLVLPLKPLIDNFGVLSVNMLSMQAVSGAGYAGVPSMSIMDNIIPFIEGEEGKVVEEPKKILGSLDDGVVKPLDIVIEATCTRVPTLVGHLESIYVELAKDASVDEVKECLSGFKGLPQQLELPSAPRQPIYVFEEPDRPQPRLDSEIGDVRGMVVSVGRVRKGNKPRSLSFISLSNNLIRGAAGIAILTAELLHATGRLD